MPAYLNAAVTEAEGPEHDVPHAISILAPLFADGAAITLGQALEAALSEPGRRPVLPG